MRDRQSRMSLRSVRATSQPQGHIAMSDPLDDFIDAAARALELPLEPDWRAAVRANLQVTLRQGVLVAEFALADDAEPAAVFRA